MKRLPLRGPGAEGWKNGSDGFESILPGRGGRMNPERQLGLPGEIQQKEIFGSEGAKEEKNFFIKESRFPDRLEGSSLLL